MLRDLTKILEPQRSTSCHKAWVILLAPPAVTHTCYLCRGLLTLNTVCIPNPRFIYLSLVLIPVFCLDAEVENYDENLHEKVVEQGGAQKRYYFENLKISVPQIKLSVFTSNKLPLDLKVHQCIPRVGSKGNRCFNLTLSVSIYSCIIQVKNNKSSSNFWHWICIISSLFCNSPSFL